MVANLQRGPESPPIPTGVAEVEMGVDEVEVEVTQGLPPPNAEVVDGIIPGAAAIAAGLVATATSRSKPLQQQQQW